MDIDQDLLPVEGNRTTVEDKQGQNNTLAVVNESDPYIVLENGNNGLHPLLIDKVVNYILANLSSTEIKKFKSVCKVWNAEAKRILKNRTMITFVHPSDLTKYMHEVNTIDKYKHHKYYQFYKIKFAQSNHELEKFFQQHGQRIKKLILQQIVPIQEKDLHWALGNYLPNLESLWVRFIPYSTLTTARPNSNCSSRSHAAFPQVKHLIVGTGTFDDWSSRYDHKFHRSVHLIPLLSCLPNLQTFTCSNLDRDCGQLESTRILEALLQVPPAILANLTKLDFPIYIKDSASADRLNRLQLNNLKEIEIELGIEVETGMSYQLFQTIGTNLRKFTLTIPKQLRAGKSTLIDIPGYEMRRLKELTLSNYLWSLEFLIYLKELESLTFIDMQLSSIFPTLSEHNLKTLKIQNESINFGVNINERLLMSRITRAFPRLEVLHVPGINDECLRMIYMDLPCLTELQCLDGEFTDFGITGVPSRILKWLFESMTDNADNVRQHLFIGNLTNLKYLRLDSMLMTQMSVLFGAVKCSKLEHLYLKTTQDFVLNRYVVEIVAEEMQANINVTNLIKPEPESKPKPQEDQMEAELKHLEEKAEILNIKIAFEEWYPILNIYVNRDGIEEENPEQARAIQARKVHKKFQEINPKESTWVATLDE